MSKKDFKGVTHGILSSNVKSVSDFLGPADKQSSPVPQQKHDIGLPQNTEKPVPLSSDEKTISKMDLVKDNAPRLSLNETEEPTIREQEPAPEKVRLTFYLSTQKTYELDDLKTTMRRMVSRRDLSKISKSSIVEAAISIVSAELKEKGLESRFAKMILEK